MKLRFAIGQILCWLLVATAASRAREPLPEVKCALDRLTAFSAGQDVPTRQKVVFVYFTPADREPPVGYHQRLARVMVDIQKFYADEMERYGLGRRTVRFDLATDGSLVLFDVKGKRPAADYLEDDGSSKGGLIARESRPVLQAAGIDEHHQTIIYFCDLRTEKDGKVTGIGPYYGSGSFTGPFESGRCWFTDATIMDPEKLSDKTTMLMDQQYHHISVGRYNSIFIGGAAHELGHALGLPHDKEQKLRTEKGISLMGSGNRTYREELRGEGGGSFLTLADAVRLASHPMFSGTDYGLTIPLKCDVKDLHAEVRDNGLDLTGQVIATPQPYAVIVYNDPYSGGDYANGRFRDYDSTTWTAPLDTDNRFTVHVGQFRPGGAKLRLVICHVNGGSSLFEYPLHVGADHTPDVTPLAVPFALQAAIHAWSAGDMNETKRLSETTATSPDTAEAVRPWATVLAKTASDAPDYPALLPAQNSPILLSDCKWQDATVGWDQPARDHFPRGLGTDLPFLCSGGRYFATGLYAHAPSRYAYDLTNLGWKSFNAVAGLQSEAVGSAIFVVKADGKELFRSPRLTGGDTADISVDIAGVKLLELITEEYHKDNRGAWAIWGDPKLSTDPPKPRQDLLRGR